MKLSSKIVAKLVNHLLSNDDALTNLLATCHPKVFHVSGPSLNLAFAVSKYGHLEPVFDKNEPDVIIKIPFKAFTDHPFDIEGVKKNVEVSGNAEFASILSKILSSLNWDYENDLSSVFGDILASRITIFIHNLAQILKEGKDSLAANVSEYLTEEAHLLVGKHEINSYIKDVDNLRDSVERLTQRISLLEEKV